MKAKQTVARAAELLLLSSSLVSSANIATQRTGAFNNRLSTSSTNSQKGGQLFPFLTNLRDSVIEHIFGPHPSKETDIHQLSKAKKNQYTNELVLRFNLSTDAEEAALSEAAARLFLDVWAFTEDFVDIRLHKSEITPLLGLLPSSLRSSYSTLISDLSAAVYQSLPSNGQSDPVEPERVVLDFSSPTWAGDNLFFQDYQPLPVITRWMKLLEAMFPSYVEYIAVGTSYEKREIPGLRVGTKRPHSSPPSSPRRTLVITGGLHAREWISTSTVNYVAWSFITSFGKDPMISKLLDEFDLVFLPVINPDGVEYTWHVDRLWRKSRQQTTLRFCRGLDLDHAFGYEWDSSATTNDPCSESYGGEQPFQAVEAIELANWARNESAHNNVEFIGLLDLHSYSQQVLFPYAFSCAVDPPNLENLEELAAGIAKTIRMSNGRTYTVSSACEGVVSADKSQPGRAWPRIESGGGSAIDWFYHEMRAHFSYQIKLRDTGSYGFLLPKEHIIPTGEEIFAAVKYFGDYVLGNNGIERVATTHSEKGGQEEEDTFRGQELRKRKLMR